MLLTEFDQEAYDRGIIINSEIKMVKQFLKSVLLTLENCVIEKVYKNSRPID